MKNCARSTHARLAPLVVTFMVLSGCASSFNPIGESKYDCNRKQDPSSFYCRSFSAVEASTNGPLPETRFGTPFRMEDQDLRQNIAPRSQAQNSPHIATSQIAAGITVPLTNLPMVLPHQFRGPVLEGAPVRNGPVVQRVWIKRHVTTDDALVESTFVYKETQAPFWAGFKPAARGAAADTALAAYPRRPAADKPEKPVSPVSGLASPADSPQIFQPTSPPARPEEEPAPPPADTGDNSMPK